MIGITNQHLAETRFYHNITLHNNRGTWGRYPKAGGATYYQLSMEGSHDNPMSLNYQEPSLTMNLFFSGKVNVYYIPP